MTASYHETDAWREAFRDGFCDNAPAGFDSEADPSNLEVYMSFVRKKLAFIGSGIKIKASRGIGYSLEDEA